MRPYAERFSEPIPFIEHEHFKIQKVYGRFFIGEIKKENQTKLLEIGGKNLN